MSRSPRIAVNGFGRIGRLVVRALLERAGTCQLVAINDLAPAATLAHLLRHDSTHGPFAGRVEVDGEDLVVDGRRVHTISERDPARLPWGRLGVDYVVEATGKHGSRRALEGHLRAGARRVVLAAPGKDLDLTVVRGVNHHAYDPQKHVLVSNASCTTNCLAPVLKVLHDAFGVDRAAMTTVHAYTNDQPLLDSHHKDPRRARAAPLSIVPTSTGAARAIGDVLPELAGRVHGIALRVPTPNVSLVDVTVQLAKEANVEDLEDAFRRAEQGDLRGILRCEQEPLVSVDFNHDPHSAVVDLPSLSAIGPRLVKVLAWYDNEWAYAVRTADLLEQMAGAERFAPDLPARRVGIKPARLGAGGGARRRPQARPRRAGPRRSAPVSR